ncbi:MAG: hypothetical protein P8Y58_09400 [Novosphingobium sp.]
MRIACVGDGPARLYFAIFAMLRRSAHGIHLFETNRADETLGWGVVFSDQTITELVDSVRRLAKRTLDPR